MLINEKALALKNKWFIFPKKIKMLFFAGSLFLASTIVVFLIVTSVIRNVVQNNISSMALQEEQLYSNKIDNWFNLSISRVENLVNTLKVVAPEQFKPIIANYVDVGDLNNVIIGFSDGTMMTGTGWNPPVGFDSSTRPWYTSAYQAGPYQIAIAPPYLSFATETVNIAISMYIPGLAGIGGVVGTSTSLESLTNLIHDYSLSEGYYFILVDEQGEIISFPKGFDTKEATQPLYQAIKDGKVSFGSNGESNSGVFIDEGFDVCSIFSIRSLEALDWQLVTIIPEAFIQERLENYTILITGLVASVLFILALVVLYAFQHLLLELEENAKHQERFKSLLGNAPSVIAICDHDFNFVEINPYGLEFFDVVEEDQALYDYNEKLLPPFQPDGTPSKEGLAVYLADAKKNGYVEFTWNYCTSKGELLPSEVVIVESNLHGEIIYIVYIRDTRQEKAMIESLESAMEMAQKANKEKSVFLANMSHEIRTPMNVISGMANIGRKANNINRKDYAFEKIKGASNHLYGIISDILDMSKIEAGKLEVRPQPFEFEEMFQNALDIVELSASKKWQKLLLCIDADLPEKVIGDKQLLTQVLANLLNNAVKFTPNEGTIRLGAGLVGMKDGLFEIKVQVTDTGCGIAPEKLLDIFEPFEQERHTFKNQVPGTGLGLAITKRILDLCGGKIWAESEVGVGSSFSFTLALPGEKKPKGNKMANTWALMISNHEEVLNYYGNHLEKEGVTSQKAQSLAQAKELMENDSFGVYIIDCAIEDGIGMDAARCIKQEHPSSTVLPLLSSNWIGLERTPEEFGVDDFLIRPVMPSAFIDLVYRHTHRQQNVGIPFPEEKKPMLFRGRRILLAEDLELNREIVAALLEETGVVIDFAENGAEAVAKYTEAPETYQLIFMDLHMPVMDGLEATEKLRQFMKIQGHEVPIVAMTANALQSNVDECLAAEMSDYVTKPLCQDLLFETLAKYLK
ncbi:MAG: response regulator [Turicibacter sp.]|nr:response regulator [Turicibacter sp.]